MNKTIAGLLFVIPFMGCALSTEETEEDIPLIIEDESYHPGGLGSYHGSVCPPTILEMPDGNGGTVKFVIPGLCDPYYIYRGCDPDPIDLPQEVIQKFDPQEGNPYD